MPAITLSIVAGTRNVESMWLLSKPSLSCLNGYKVVVGAVIRNDRKHALICNLALSLSNIIDHLILMCFNFLFKLLVANSKYDSLNKLLIDSAVGD